MNLKIPPKSVSYSILFVLVLVTLINVQWYIRIINGQQSSIVASTEATQKLKIFCIILTTEESLKHRAALAEKTWTRKCNNYKFVLKTTSYDSNVVLIRSLHGVGNILQPPGLTIDQYDYLTEKVYASFAFVYAEYPTYDWYVKADDDAFVFVDNLRAFLSQHNPNLPVTFGYDLKSDQIESGFHSGGCYVMSGEAFRRIGAKLTTNSTFCPDSGIEDIDVATCMRMLKVYPGKSLDQSGKERFHPVDVVKHYTGNFPEWLKELAANPLRSGEYCCSDNTISFHHLNPDDMIKLNEIVEAKKSSLKFKHIIDYYGFPSEKPSIT